MKVIGKDLIITDPCYIAKDADWGESFNWEDYCIEPFIIVLISSEPDPAPAYFRAPKHTPFSE